MKKKNKIKMFFISLCIMAIALVLPFSMAKAPTVGVAEQTVTAVEEKTGLVLTARYIYCRECSTNGVSTGLAHQIEEMSLTTGPSYTLGTEFEVVFTVTFKHKDGTEAIFEGEIPIESFTCDEDVDIDVNTNVVAGTYNTFYLNYATLTRDASEHVIDEWSLVENQIHFANCKVCGIVSGTCSGGVATCNEKAICDVCSLAYGDLDENAHVWDEGIVTTEPTCAKVGVKTYTCQNNNEHIRTEDVAIDENAHVWDEGIITTEPTATEEGVKTFTCQNNGEHTYTEAVPATGEVASEEISVDESSEEEVSVDSSVDEESDEESLVESTIDSSVTESAEIEDKSESESESVQESEKESNSVIDEAAGCFGSVTGLSIGITLLGAVICLKKKQD